MVNLNALQQSQIQDDVVLAHDDPRWQKLHDIILDRSFLTGDFILSSGAHSKFLFQLRQTTMLGEGATIIAEVVLEYMQRHGIECIGGLVQGAVPIAQAVGVMGHVKGHEIDAFFVRKAAKTHGAKERIDGYVRDNAEVLIVDDVATKGGSIKDAVEGLVAEHPSCFVKRALVIVDREEGASQALSARGIQLVSLFKKSDFPIPV